MNERQKIIMEFIKNNNIINIQEILKYLSKTYNKKVSKITVNRDLKFLVDNNLIDKQWRWPSVKYKLSTSFYLLENIDVSKYFYVNEWLRAAKKSFNFNVFEDLNKIDLFSENEINELNELNTIFQNNIKSLPKEIVKKEFERLLIELSWKSSQIEWNTYNLLETEFLLKEKIESKGHTKAESTMILNHKKAFDYIKENNIKDIDFKVVKKVHEILTLDMNISKEFRNTPVWITWTQYLPLKNNKEIEKAVKLACKLVNNEKNIIVKSFLLNLLIAYIQPFNDWNKRTSRMLWNYILLSNNFCPLSFRTIDTLEYKKAILLFYEQNNISYFKKLFIEQFQFVINSYFLIK